jgi:predicted ATPase
MIKNILLKFGRGPGIPADQIQTTPITVFVGPNNSGKSKVLQELHSCCSNGQRNMANVILEQIEFESLSHEKAEERNRHCHPPSALERCKPSPASGFVHAVVFGLWPNRRATDSTLQQIHR